MLELAKALGAEIGCTKTLCSDYEWLSEDRLVGLSGKKTSPRLVISIGISGQIQYTVGIRGARIAVAINKDSNAPIFPLSDYGIVGDLYQVVPAFVMNSKLKTLGIPANEIDSLAKAASIAKKLEARGVIFITGWSKDDQRFSSGA